MDLQYVGHASRMLSHVTVARASWSMRAAAAAPSRFGAATGTGAVLAFRLSLIEAYGSEDGEHAEEAAAAVAAAAAAAPAPAAEAPATAEQQALPAAGAAWNVRACSTGSESPPAKARVILSRHREQAS